ncbi:uncharacterized protein LOC111327513 [Stylophora pistillata]|uniref:uncharacterized protein LOC111327513 n=1 Tax=Stylophora pistillata TaxID=50429 RepID=UPI000C03DDC2|nr:uncharacterized protein LOC111327513 [Stylophora pistillata]
MGFLWSLVAISAGYFLGEIVRLALRRILPRVYYPYANELISTFQLSVCVFEISVIGRFYNSWIALLCSFVLLTVKNVGFIFEGAFANPCGLLEDLVYEKGYWLSDNIAKIFFQVLGALLSFPFIQMLWLSTWSELHYQQIKRGLRSTLDVSLLYGFSIEILATFVSTASDFLSRGTLRRFNPVIRSAICVLLSFFLSETTGTWMNPALATAQTFVYCSRNEVITEHLFVFWLGPIIGTLAAIEMNTLFLKPSVITQGREKNLAKKIKQSSAKNHRDGAVNSNRNQKERFAKNA